MSTSVTAFQAPALDKVRILVVGDVMLDRYWFGDVSRISPEAPVPIVRIEKREARLGGAANVARNAAALGAHAGLLGVVGADEAGTEVEQLLQGGGIHSYLKRDDAISTIIPPPTNGSSNKESHSQRENENATRLTPKVMLAMTMARPSPRTDRRDAR